MLLTATARSVSLGFGLCALFLCACGDDDAPPVDRCAAVSCDSGYTCGASDGLCAPVAVCDPAATPWDGVRPVFRDATATSGLVEAGALGQRINAIDFNGDGFVDLAIRAVGTGHDDFVMGTRVTWLLRNRGDGTFEDVAKERGLDLSGVDAGLFVDLDNDGDKDLVVGGFLDRARYFVNDKGKFTDRSSRLVDGALPYFVSSISAADYDRDGLLDRLALSHLHRALDRLYRRR